MIRLHDKRSPRAGDTDHELGPHLRAGTPVLSEPRIRPVSFPAVAARMTCMRHPAAP